MTILEALQSTVAGYPLSDNTFERVIIDRGMSATDTYITKSVEFELATADIYKVLSTAANISEGGFSVSVSERSNFLQMANAIFEKYNQITVSKPVISNKTAQW